MTWLGLDIGGANLKAADGRGFALSRPFPLWQRPGDLAKELAATLAASPAANRLAVTMTGELADCFATKAEGVAAICGAVVQAAARRDVQIYGVDGQFVAPEAALARPLVVAASNWHALAAFAGRFAPAGSALLVDIGSTSVDLIPLEAGRPAARGANDPERLVAGELVYTGVQRTPVCALVPALPWGERVCPVAAELFATTWDAYLVLGDLPEEPENRQTADGRPATRALAIDRLARMICADRTLFTEGDAERAAAAISAAQLAKLGNAVRQAIGRAPPETVILGGQGEFLARRLVQKLGWRSEVSSLAERLGSQVSACAPAHAVAVLAGEQLP
ncbi:MAG: hydantoinase/oxoprolinase family protein [Pirellulales bacterium]